MSTSDPVMDIFLQQGDVYFGDAGTRIRTVLGSCVAVTMWHPVLRIGGMCHYMLPTRTPRGAKLCTRIRSVPIGFPSRRARDQRELDGKYADEALELMFAEIQRSGSRPDEFQIKLFGGGNMFPLAPRSAHHVGTRNIGVVSCLLAHHGLAASARHLGGFGHRNLIFDIGSGHVWMRHQQPAAIPRHRLELQCQAA